MSKPVLEFVIDGQKIRNVCKRCKSNFESKRRISNTSYYAEKDKAYYEANKEAIHLRNRTYRQENREKVCAQKKEYYENNKATIKQYHANNKDKRNAYKRERFASDAVFRIVESLRSRIHDVLRNVNKKHSSKLIGCCRDDLVQWLGFQFTPEYTWANYGTSWQMDHVIPISFFDMSSLPERNYAFHWTNIRPLNTKANLSKSSKILQHDILQHINVLKSFPGYQGHHESGCWQRVELWYGKNSEDDESFEDFLKWAIRIQNPKSIKTKDMGMVQRLNDNGSEVIGHRQ